MAKKQTQEMMRVITQESMGEIKQLLTLMQRRAKTPEARATLNGISGAIETTMRTPSLLALEIDDAIKDVLNRFNAEFLSENDSEISAGTCRIIEEMLNVREATSVVTMSANKKAEFKAFQKAKKSRFPNKKELKARFEKTFEQTEKNAESYRKQIKLLGKAVSLQQLGNMIRKTMNEVNAVNAQIEELKKKFKSTKDPVTRANLDSEYNQLLGKKASLANTIMRANNARKKVGDMKNVLDEYGQQQSIVDLSDYNQEEMADVIAALAKGDKEDMKEIKGHEDLMGKKEADTQKYAAASASFQGRNSLADEIMKDEMSDMEIASLGNIDVSGSASLADLMGE